MLFYEMRGQLALGSRAIAPDFLAWFCRHYEAKRSTLLTLQYDGSVSRRLDA
jgi:hypothetical protein